MARAPRATSRLSQPRTAAAPKDDEPAPTEPSERVDGRKTRSQRVETLVEGIRRQILEDIITGEMRPSSIVQLGVLAERYGVSRTPVREALAILERQGLITTLPYKGYLVRPIEPSDVHDLYLVRRAIEGAAAELAAGRLTEEQLGQLAAMRPPQVNQMTLGYDEYAHRYHHMIVTAAGSPRLLAIFDNVYNDVRRLQYAGIGNPRPDLIHAEHQEILNALVAGDAQAARLLMERHISAVESRALQAWLNGPG